MRLTVLGGSGAWPTAAQACSGYLLVHHGFRVLVDPGFAVMPRLQEHASPASVDAVLVSHGHPDHCADLAPLLRARAYADPPCPPLAVHAPPGALDAVHDEGMAVVTYTVNDADDMRKALDKGVDGLITDYPDIARQVIREHERSEAAEEAGAAA